MTAEELYIRVARAELERDQAIERAERAEAAQRDMACWLSEPPQFGKVMEVAGVPISDVAAIYELLDEWRRHGGNETLIGYYAARGAA